MTRDANATLNPTGGASASPPPLAGEGQGEGTQAQPRLPPSPHPSPASGRGSRQHCGNRFALSHSKPLIGPPMPLRFDDIGNRLKAFRLGSGLSADEIANRLGISRTALYRFEKGELAKIETLEKLAELLGVSVPTLLGVGVEYVASAVAYFERMRQIEETSEHIIVLAGPISYLLASDAFDGPRRRAARERPGAP